MDENVSDEDAAQKSMQYLLFSYTTTDDSGESQTLSDDEKEALKTTAQAFDDRLKGGEDMGDCCISSRTYSPDSYI